jgi:hypothetical protein
VIKQFNFYDIYGYLLPGTLLLALFWLPFGILSNTWPNQDLSKTVFLAAAAYILGHLIQSIANSVVPSKIANTVVPSKLKGEKMQLRFPSDLYLDKTNSIFSDDFKARLRDQVKDFLKLDLRVEADGSGKDETSKTRQAAFFQARTYLLSKKSAHYVEQFEGLYALMRGLFCSFLAGAFYLAGWGLSFHREHCWVRTVIGILLAAAVLGAFWFSFLALKRGADANKAKEAVQHLATCLALTLLCAGFWAGDGQPGEFWQCLPAFAELILWTGFCLALIAASRCFAFYKYYADLFAQTVWRDFSAYRSFEVDSKPSS